MCISSYSHFALLFCAIPTHDWPPSPILPLPIYGIMKDPFVSPNTFLWSSDIHVRDETEIFSKMSEFLMGFVLLYIRINPNFE